MKKVIVLALGLLLAGGMAFGIDLSSYSLSGSVTMTWGFGGQLLDNSAAFAGEIPSADFTSAMGDAPETSDDGLDLNMTLSVTDANNNVVVSAATADFDWPLLTGWDSDEAQAVDYIEFPNIIPDILGVKLNAGTTTVSTGVTSAASDTGNENVVITLTPVDTIFLEVGAVLGMTTLEKALWATPTTQWDYTTVIDFATSIYGEFMLELNAEDSVTIGAGIVIDTAYGKDSVETSDGNIWTQTFATTAGTGLGWATYPIGVAVDAAIGDLSASIDGQLRLVSGDDPDVASIAGFNAAYKMPLYGAVSVSYDLYIGEDDIAAAAADGAEAAIAELKSDVFDAMQGVATDEQYLEDATDVDTIQAVAVAEEALALAVAENDATATVALDSTAASDAADDLADAEDDLAEAQGEVDVAALESALETSKAALVDAEAALARAEEHAAEILANDPDVITISPSLTFKYSSDYWKWYDDRVTAVAATIFDAAVAAVAADAFEYKGDVTAAGFLGRPMSLDVGVDVSGIAGMIDIALDASLGFGDSAEYHSYGLYQTATGATFTAASTIASTTPTISTADVAAVNDSWFATSGLAMTLGATVTLTLFDDALTVSDAFSYTADGLGITGADDAALFGTYLNQIVNTTTIEYDIQVDQSTAVTLFGEVAITNLGYEKQMGTTYTAAGATTSTETVSKLELDYEAGVEVTVSF